MIDERCFLDDFDHFLITWGSKWPKIAAEVPGSGSFPEGSVPWGLGFSGCAPR